MEPRFTILGHTRLRIGDRWEDAWGPTRPRGILAVLLLHPGQSISFETLIEWVWPDGHGPERDNTFHTYARRIRAALKRMPDPPSLTVGDRALRLDVAPRQVDYWCLRRAVDEAAATDDHERVAASLSTALRLWSGPPLADAKGGRAEHFRAMAGDTHLVHAHDALLAALTALGRHDEVLRGWADLTAEQQANPVLARHHAAALAAARPAAPAVPAVPAPDLLPRDVPDFTGRTDLLDHLDAALGRGAGDPAGLALLVGAPGIGKTSLVVHWAHRVADRFPGGVLFADLNGFSGGRPTGADEVVTAFLAAFGFPADRLAHATDRAARLRRLVAGRGALVVLDNAADADAVLPVIDCLATCAVVVTSRRVLSRVSRRGAVTVHVPPMTGAESVTWLSGHLGPRARRERDAVARLAAACDGSPLALRGVLDHVTARPGVALAEFVEELRVTPNLLSLGDDGDGTESSIRTVFSWSYRALSPEQRAMFRALGPHPGPDIGVDAAAATAGIDHAAARRALDALVRANLLTQPHSRARYQFHDLIRGYATERAAAEDPTEAGAAEARMFEFYRRTAAAADAVVFPFRPPLPAITATDGVDPVRFDTDEQALDWCVRERANLVALIRLAERRGLHDHARGLPMAVGEMLHRLGYVNDVLVGLDIAIDAARALSDEGGEADAVSALGFVHVLTRDFVAAESCLRAAGELYERVGDVVGGAMVLHQLAALRVQQGRFTEAVDLNRTALAAMRGHDDVAGLAPVVTRGLAEAHRRTGDLAAAARLCREALAQAEAIADERTEARCRGEMGAITFAAGDVALAKGYCVRALIGLEHLRDHQHAGETLTLLTAIHRAQGDLAEAERCARRAVAACRKARDDTGELTAYDALGQVLHDRGCLDEAAETWSTALLIAEDIGDPLAAVLSDRLIHNGVPH